MRTYKEQSQKLSRTLDDNSKASRQASWDVILQKKDVIQGCYLCADPSCISGEKCGKSKDFGGLLPPDTTPWTVKYYSTTQGHDGQPNEWEHVVPGAAYRGAGMGKRYGSAPVISLPKEVHRGGIHGDGGGVSSTGSSSSATIWSEGLAEMLKQGQFDEALKKGAIDGIIASAMHGKNLFDALGGYLNLVSAHLSKGDITKSQADDISSSLTSLVYDIQERPDLYGLGKKV